MRAILVLVLLVLTSCAGQRSARDIELVARQATAVLTFAKGTSFSPHRIAVTTC
jgi:hypothetical protein